MKHSTLFASLFLMSTLFIACKKDTLSHQDEFERSYNTWLAFKQSSGNSYMYTVSNGSWTGFGWRTIITVTNGKVTQRDYKLTPAANSLPIPPDKLAWIEDESEINTHTDMAAPAVTLDEVYEKARTEWLIKRKSASIYFEAKNDGMISSCGYVNDGCQDDCFVGITISSIQPL